jgi:hypothetical protein
LRASVLASILATLLFAGLAGLASADGNGSPGDCLGGPSVDGDADHLEYDAGTGNVVSGVCIKSGSNTFDGDKHSDPLGDGFYDNNGNVVDEADACYSISGVGSQTVEVDRLFSSNQCQGLSHIDLITSICTDCNPCQSDCEPCESDCEPCQNDCEPVDPCEEDPQSCEPILDCDDEEFAAEHPECNPFTLCVDGDFVTATESDQLTDTGDCGTVLLCLDGESLTANEFDAENDPDLEDADPGDCPTDEPVTTTTVTTAPTPPTVTQEVGGVQEEAPIEEVASLPSAGYPSRSGTALGSLALAIALLGIGSASAVAARRQS